MPASYAFHAAMQNFQARVRRCRTLTIWNVPFIRRQKWLARCEPPSPDWKASWFQSTCPAPTARWSATQSAPPRRYPLKSTAVLPRTVYAAAHVVADPLRMADPWQAVGRRLGRDAEIPPSPLGPRPEDRRSHGHLAARHGAGLAGREGAHPPLARRGENRRWRRPRLRRGHRPARPRKGRVARRRDRRL